MAVVLEHPAFDLNSASRQTVNPRHNVTPVFFVQKHQAFIGPLVRDVVHLTPMDDVQRIDWRPAPAHSWECPTPGLSRSRHFASASTDGSTGQACPAAAGTAAGTGSGVPSRRSLNHWMTE